MKSVLFKLASLSSNTNSFGLRGAVLVARDGDAWEVGINHLAVDHLRSNGNKVTLDVDDEGHIHGSPVFSFEIPRKFPKAPPEVIRQLFKEPAVANRET